MNYINQKTERKKKIKKTTNSTIYTIDYLHVEKMKYFKELQDIILPKKIKDLEKSKKQNILSEIKKLTNEIKNIQDKIEEVDYFFKITDIINKYYSSDNEGEKFNMTIEYYTILKMEMSNKYNNIVLSKKCKNCDQEDCLIENEELSCTLCGFVNDKYISSTVSHKESKESYSYIPNDLHYKRLDYFKQWLNQIQGREQTDIPDIVIDEILLQLNIERIKDISKISNKLVKRLLKKTGNSKYYEHIPYIIYKISGTRPINIPSQIEEIFIIMFIEVEKVWEYVKIPERSSFFSTPYILHKFSQILGLNEYLVHFPLLKSREKRYYQDLMWKQVIEIFNNVPSKNIFLKDIEWKFISSI